MKYKKNLFVTGFLTLCACLFFSVSTAQGVTFTVTKTADTDDGICSDADCSLREAIFAANDLAGTDTIVFKSSVFAEPNPVQQIFLSLNLPELVVEDHLNINGPGSKQLIINGNNDDRIFKIQNKMVSIKDLALINGYANAGNFGQGNPIECTGGAIHNLGSLLLYRLRIGLNKADCQGGGIMNGNSLTVIYSVINNNHSNQYGGGIYSHNGELEVANTTISDNYAQFSGGGIRSAADSAMSLNNVTVSHNSADNEGGGIVADFPSTSSDRKMMRNTIVANNTAPSHPDVMGVFLTQGSNLIRVSDGNNYFLPGNPNTKGDYVGSTASPRDPMLGPLQNNGGLSNTRALLSGSPAIDKGDQCVTLASSCVENKPPISLVYDQRFTGFNRKIGAGVDIGAYEAEPLVTSINGSVTYAITPMNQSLTTVPGVVVTATGTSSASDTTDSSGNYSIENLSAGGQYNVTAAKSGDVNGISAFDATLILRHVAAGGQGANALSNNQKLAADTNTDNDISAFDATQILRYVAANGANANTGQVGKWKFVPATKNYQSLGNSLAGQNYEAVLIGEINGDWTQPDGSIAPEEGGKIQVETTESFKETQAEIALPDDAHAKTGNIVVVPISLSNVSSKSISGYSFDVTFDPTVLQPDSAMPVETSGTLSREIIVVHNTDQSGRIGIAASGVITSEQFPINGVLLKLRFRTIKTTDDLKNQTANLAFQQSPIFEDEVGSVIAIKTTNGSIRFYGDKADKSLTMISGRITTAEGKGIRNVMVTLAGAKGENRSVLSGANGEYRFADVPTGETFTVSINSKRFQFIQTSQTRTIFAEAREINFTAKE